MSKVSVPWAASACWVTLVVPFWEISVDVTGPPMFVNVAAATAECGSLVATSMSGIVADTALALNEPVD